jgi:hypothetical protein
MFTKCGNAAVKFVERAVPLYSCKARTMKGGIVPFGEFQNRLCTEK